MLVTDFAWKKKAIALFSSLLTNIFTYNAIKQFQLHINNVIIDINNIYTYYGLFILFEASILLTKIYLNFVLAIEALIIIDDDLDYNKRINNSLISAKPIMA